MRLNSATSRKEAKRTWEELEISMRNYKERESLSKKEMAKKMDEAKKEVNTRESSVYLKVKIYKVSAEFLAKKTIVDGSASVWPMMQKQSILSRTS